MHEIILHHYDLSPYAEKIRLVMGVKGLAWRSVQIPIVMPKPDLTALTGGYRLTPVLQIGADITCDTRAIAAALEALAPEPTLYPGDQPAIARGISTWLEGLFMDVIMLYMARDAFPKEFVEDRRGMISGGFDPKAAAGVAPAKRDQIRYRLDLVERQLGVGHRFLIGDAPCIADLSAYHPLWALRADPELAALLEPFEALRAWMDRVAAIGHGERREMESSEAIEIARAAEPSTPVSEDPRDPNGRKPGDRVRVLPEAYGNCPVDGEIVSSDAQHLAIRRRDERVGEVVVHFPREGYLTFPLS